MMKYVKFLILTLVFMSLMVVGHEMVHAQGKAPLLPELPGTAGRAGMFAGVSNGRVLCMGGADFPAGPPWEGGSKKWHSDVFAWQEEDRAWANISEGMPLALGYGVSATHKEKVILVGGSNSIGHSRETWAVKWSGDQMNWERYPDLPHALANMAGALVGDLLVVVGGMESPDSKPLATVYGLDLGHLDKGWFKLPAWPGPERIFPVCATFDGRLYVFSGENTSINAKGIEQRYILQDAYCFTPAYGENGWEGTWSKLAAIPRGMSAGPSPAPVLHNGTFRFWGGVDRVVALHTNAATHPGISGDVFYYDPASDGWRHSPSESVLPGRVTLPTVMFNGDTYYVSGEVKPGVRTNQIIGVPNQ